MRVETCEYKIQAKHEQMPGAGGRNQANYRVRKDLKGKRCPVKVTHGKREKKGSIKFSEEVEESIKPRLKKGVKQKNVSKKAIDLCDRAVDTIISTGIKGLKNLNCNFVARECGTSASYLTRIFKEIKGISLRTLIKHEKLSRFLQLHIEKRDITIREAAEILGFDDVDYFIRSFRDHFGTTPRRYLDFLKK
jgi:AraC-like DNA-binding protein